MLELSEEQGYCPYCGELISLLIDTSEPSQSYIEDCQVCCRPISVNVSISGDGTVAMSLHDENDTY